VGGAWLSINYRLIKLTLKELFLIYRQLNRKFYFINISRAELVKLICRPMVK